MGWRRIPLIVPTPVQGTRTEYFRVSAAMRGRHPSGRGYVPLIVPTPVQCARLDGGRMGAMGLSAHWSYILLFLML